MRKVVLMVFRKMLTKYGVSGKNSEPTDGSLVKESSVDAKSRIRKNHLFIAACAAGIIGIGACASLDSAFAPPAAQVQAASLSAWDGIKQQEKTSSDAKYLDRMNRVAPRIIAAAGGNPDEWEVVVFDSKQLNAFALPGGKIGFYTGIMDLMENDDQIAAVMGHEVAHVNFQHSAKRAGRAAQTQFGLSAAQSALSVGNVASAGLWMQALGLGAQVGNVLPFSRSHESEADRVGLRYMARAGYNPDEAVRFWTNMSQAKEGQAPAEFLSTHPSDATRIRALQKEIDLLKAGS